MSKTNPDNYTGLNEEHVHFILQRCAINKKKCWVWTGAVSSGGYGNTSITTNNVKRWVVVHRAVYTVRVGPVDPNLELDHLCRDRACCNPEHLEVVTSAVNTQRGNSPPAKNKAKDHCKHGHPFDKENTWVSPKSGRRRCKACDRVRRADKRKAAASAKQRNKP